MASLLQTHRRHRSTACMARCITVPIPGVSSEQEVGSTLTKEPRQSNIRYARTARGQR